MNNFYLTEATRDLLLSTVKAEIAQALTDVRANRATQNVSTEPPKSFFIFDGPNTYQCPAVIMVVDSMEFLDEQTGPNFINGHVKVFVSAVVEDREAQLLTIKSERYQAALFAILNRRTLEDQSKNLKIYSMVLRAAFSPIYTKKRDDGGGNLRKEVSLELQVKHFENPT